MATMPSAKPTWARAGVAMQSPTAHTPGSPVRQQLVDLDEAALVDLRRRCRRGRGRRCRAGGRPTRRRRRRRAVVALDRCTVVPPSPGVWPVTLTPVLDVDAPLLERALDDLGDVVVAAGEDLGQRLEDRDLACRGRRSIEANSQPMAPPPMTAAAAGSSAIDSTSSEVITIVPSTSKPGMVRGSEPAARITASPVSSTSPRRRRRTR